MRDTGRAFALVLALTFALMTGTMFSTQDRAYALPLLVPAAAAALPFSIVSAGVGGGAFTVSTAGAIASAAITAASVLVGPWAVEMGWDWATSTPTNYGDPPANPSAGGYLAPGLADPCGARFFTCAVYDPSYPTDKAGFSVRRTTATTLSTSQGGANLVGYNAAGQVIINAGSGVSSPGGHFWGASGPEGLAGWIVTANSTTSQQFTRGTCDAIIIVGSVPGCSTTPPPAVESGTTPLTVTPKTDWRKADGTVGSTLGTGSSITRGGTRGGSMTFPAAPAGGTVTGRSAPVTRADGTVVGDGVSPSGSPWQPPPVPSTYPDCQAGGCVMTLTRTGPDGGIETCRAGSCQSYSEVVARYPGTGTGVSTGPRTASDGNAYQCKFGAYAVAVAECQVIPGVGVTPATGTDTANCIRSGISWNPTSWVTEPVRCALSDAFGVRPATQARMSALRARVATVPPFSLIGAVGSWLAPFGTLGQSCPDWSVKVGPATTPILCGQGYAEKVHENRSLFGAAMTLAMLGPFAWRIWHAAIPVIKVQRGS